MITLKLEKKELDPKFFAKRPAAEDDCARVISSDVRIEVDGKLAIYYVKRFPIELEPLRKAVSSIKFGVTGRTDGMVTTSKVFGHMPRNPLRKDACAAAVLASQDPETHKVVCDVAKTIGEIYFRAHPDLYAMHHAQFIEKVLFEYSLAGTPFTSGIINENNPLPYRFDKGNFLGVWSAMVTLRDGITGGNLCVPEIDTRIDVADRSLLLFDGQGLMHGVTPIARRTNSSKRFTIVYYSLLQMWKCLPVSEEIDRWRGRRDAYEIRNLEKRGES